MTIEDQDDGAATQTFQVTYDPFASTLVNVPGRINNSADASMEPVFVSRLDVDDRTDDDRHVFELIAGEGSANNVLFLIEDGSLFWIGCETVDSETTPSCQVRLRTTDLAGNVLHQSLEIDVNDATTSKMFASDRRPPVNEVSGPGLTKSKSSSMATSNYCQAVLPSSALEIPQARLKPV